MLGRRRRAEVRLQRHVAEILQREDADVVGVAEDAGHRQRHALKSRATLANGSVAKSIGAGVQRQHDRFGRPASSTRKYRRSEASPVSGTTRGARVARPLARR